MASTVALARWFGSAGILVRFMPGLSVAYLSIVNARPIQTETLPRAFTEDRTTQAPPQLNPRVDAPAKVSGGARYVGDVTRPGMLIGAVLRSPVPHAEIVSIDVAAAKQLPGVRAVLTGADLPDVRMGRTLRDMPVLARDRVRFIGEKVVAVAADNAEIAEEAVALVRVEYRELPAVFDPIEAILPDAPPIHDPALIRAWSEGALIQGLGYP